MSYPQNTFATTSGALTATGAETVHDTTVTISFCVNGKASTKTAITDGATPTTDYNTGAAFPSLTANKGAAVVWALTAGGTIKCMQGEIVDMSGGNFVTAPPFPNVPVDVCPFAYQLLKASSTAGTITFGSSNWNATGFTNSIVNVHRLPSRPQIA